MKQNFKNAAYAFGIIALALTGCRKEQMSLNPALNNDSESEIQTLAMQTETESNSLEVMYDESTNEMTMTNEGIANDYLVTSEDFGIDPATGIGSSRSNVRNNSFVRCFHGLKLDTTQMREVRGALKNYHDCKASALKRARAIHAALVAKYKDLAAEQAKLLKAGKITRAEYKQRMERLRHAFQKDMRELQLKEKLNEALKGCYAKFLRQLNGILTERQWKAFVACHRK